MMPKVGGADVFRAAECLPRKPKIIIISALAELWHVRQPTLQAFAVLPKPVDFSRLIGAIDSAVG